VTMVVLVTWAGEGAGAPGVLQRPMSFGDPWVAPVHAHSERIEQSTVVQGARDFPGRAGALAGRGLLGSGR